MKYKVVILLALVWSGAFGQQGKPSQFQNMLHNYYEEFLKLNPTTATFKGDNRYNHLIENRFSLPYRHAEQSLYRRYLDSLRRYNITDEKDKLSYSIFEYELNMKLEATQFRNYLRPLSQMSDFRIQFAQMGSGNGIHPFKTVKDYDDFLKRSQGFVAITDTVISNLRKGIDQKMLQPKPNILKVIGQLKTVITDDVTSSMFYKPVNSFPADFSQADKDRLSKAYADAIENRINPAYQRLLTFLENEYLQHATETVGLNALPDGKKEYAFLVRWYTSTKITPEEVYQTGLKEVARIAAEMEKIKNETGFKGTLNDFFNYMTTDPKFFPFKTDEEVTEAYRQIHERMKPHIGKQFNIIPKTPFEIRPIEKYRAASAAAHYVTGTPDGSRPGVFYFPVLDATKYHYWRMEDLFLHEAIPGHHFERSLVTENPNLPANQKVGSYGAYTEGWGLYSEKLGAALGLYTDPYQRMGQLQGEMHRAIRLVVDVGIHNKGWTREEAIKYMMENEPIAEQNAIQEVERYITMPGQAVSYKIGELKILELRKKAEDVLGKNFEVRAFHDQVLKDGAMPLVIFEPKIESWIRNHGK